MAVKKNNGKILKPRDPNSKALESPIFRNKIIPNKKKEFKEKEFNDDL